MKDSTGKTDVLKTVSVLSNGLMLAVTVVSVTIAVMKSQEVDRYAAQIADIRQNIAGMVKVADNMKDVDAGLLRQITELKGTTTTDITLLNERISNVTKLLEEIKTLVMKR
ncbi:MAG: hypothetical protein WC455_16010 [Dehalococcoidia bacterium]|jgi:septal ring factor EnvC (AmiA/AmiB activator)